MRPVFTSCSTTAVVPGNFPTMAFAGTTVGYVEWDHCWAFDGGDYSGEGCGFKYASTYRENNTPELARVIKNCIGAHNKPPRSCTFSWTPPRFIPGITPCTTPPEVPSFEAPYWAILS